ncbi:hypothetical protein AQJ58_33735 [Streptomyces sp. DSM 15324]|nr:hypothetical protein AQJ58_33735 [Streptomyces sp. DSM 15324]
MASSGDDDRDDKPTGGTATAPAPSITLPTGLPSTLPSGLPSRLPSTLPTELPSDLDSLLPSLTALLP